MEGRFQRLLGERNDFAVNWANSDFDEAARVYAERDGFGLNRLLARDDLWVTHARTLQFHMFLVENVPLGSCVFDFQHPWTQERLLSKGRFNVVAALERYKRGTERAGMPKRNGVVFGSNATL